MGTWSADMLGSDSALDALSILEDIIGFSGPEPDEDSLYPLPSVKDTEKKAKIAGCLINSEKAVLNNRRFSTEDWSVVSCVYMSAGVPLPALLKKRAIKACKEEIDGIPDMGWNDDGIEREKVLYALMHDLENYTGEKAIPIEHIGLLEKISNSEKEKEEAVKKIELINAEQAVAIILDLALQKAEIKATKKMEKKVDKLRNKHRKHAEKKLNKLVRHFNSNDPKYQITGPWNKKD